MNMDISKALKELRKEMSFNQKEFADKIGITQTYISLLENGKKIPSLEVIAKYEQLTQKPLSIILWKALTEENVPKSKRLAFRQLKPLVDNLINQMF